MWLPPERALSQEAKEDEVRLIVRHGRVEVVALDLNSIDVRRHANDVKILQAVKRAVSTLRHEAPEERDEPMAR